MSLALHLTCPKISNFRNVGRVKSHIQAVWYQIVPHGRYIFFTCARTHLSAISVFDIFKSFPCFPCFHFEYWITRQLCWSRCKSVAVYVSLRFSNILVDWYFSWPYFNFHWLNFCEFFSGVFFALAEEKKTRQKSRQKMFPQTLYSLSRENAILATLILPSEKSNGSYKLKSLGASS